MQHGGQERSDPGNNFGIRSAAVIFGAVALITSCSRSTEPDAAEISPPPPAQVTPVVASVLAAPVPVPATDGKDHLAYELQLTNTLAQDVTLTSLAVVAGDQTLMTLSGDNLTYWTRVIGNPTPTRKVGPGQTALVWLDVGLNRPATIPNDLTHAISVAIPKPQPPLFPATLTEKVGQVTVQTRKPMVIAPPLDGPNWLDGNSCCDMTAHRMAMNPLNGQLWAAERFAIDYVQLGPGGRIFAGDKARPESYPYFGADIRAVAEGPVVSVKDGLPEQVAGRNPTGLPLDQYAGNHIVQDIGDGNYALYAHLKTGSISVKVGDRLSSGQVIALLGNSGNTDGPHLHFHVMSTPDPLRSNGLPFVLSSFTLDGRIASIDAEDAIEAGQPAPMQPGFTPRDESAVSPLVLDVMSYANR